MTRTSMNCEEALRLLAEHLDQELEPSDAQAIESHLEECRSCYSRAEFERRLKDQIAELRRAEVASVLEERVRRLVRAFEADESAGDLPA